MTKPTRNYNLTEREEEALKQAIGRWNGFITAEQRATLIDHAYWDSPDYNALKSQINYEGSPDSALTSIIEVLKTQDISATPFIHEVGATLDLTKVVDRIVHTDLAPHINGNHVHITPSQQESPS